jgi:hypothetical protein
MTATKIYQRLIGIGFVGVLVSGLACSPCEDTPQVEGTWDCTTNWMCEGERESVPCSYEQRATCTGSRLSSAGVLSLGSAQWSETIEGFCLQSGDSLHSTRTAIQTVPMNEAARQFEEERLDGQNLAVATNALQLVHQSRITSLTDTQLVAVTDEGRTTTCRR